VFLLVESKTQTPVQLQLIIPENFKLKKLKPNSYLCQNNKGKEERTPITGVAKVVVHCSAGTFVVTQTSILCINICGKNRHLRQVRNRYL
jgi:hypothetical protein